MKPVLKVLLANGVTDRVRDSIQLRRDIRQMCMCRIGNRSSRSGRRSVERRFVVMTCGLRHAPLPLSPARSITSDKDGAIRESKLLARHSIACRHKGRAVLRDWHF
jgi:hypothetical protein